MKKGDSYKIWIEWVNWIDIEAALASQIYSPYEWIPTCLTVAIIHCYLYTPIYLYLVPVTFLNPCG